MDRQLETRHLAMANRSISEGEARVAEQVELVARLKERGENADSAEVLLDLFRQTLVAWKDHRNLIFSLLEN